MLKLLLFDWDGTVADSVGKIIECKCQIALKYKLIPPASQQVRKVLGMEFQKAMSLCFPEADTSLLSTLGIEFHFLMQQDHFQAPLFPKANEVLRALKKEAFILAIVTSKAEKEMRRAIQFNHLTCMFDMICCGESYKAKPDPTMLYYLMEKFNVSPQECVMVGDTTIDILFAANAGIKTIGVTFGAHSPMELEAHHPIALIDNWPQLLKQIYYLSHSMDRKIC